MTGVRGRCCACRWGEASPDKRCGLMMECSGSSNECSGWKLDLNRVTRRCGVGCSSLRREKNVTV